MNKTIQPRKARKQLLYKGDFHRLKREVGVHLSKSLKEKYNKRSLTIRKGDEVKVVRGRFSGTTGKVEKVDLRKRKIFVDGVQVPKADGTKRKVPIAPSNVIVTKLELNDKLRKEKLEGKKTETKEKPKEAKA